MNIASTQNDKLDIIRWITQLQDTTIITRIKSIQYEDESVPQWQQDIVIERIESATQADYIPWDDAKNLLKK